MKVIKTSSEYKRNDRQETDDEYVTHSTPLWMKIFHLPSEPAWFMTVTILNYITVIGHLYLSVNAKCINLLKTLKVSELFYLLDIFYMCDIILILGSKYIRNLDLPQINLSMRPLSMLLIEVLSLLPLELLSTNNKMFCILHTNRCIRIARILHIFKQYYNLVDSKLYIKVLEMFSCILFITMITYSVYCNVQCSYFKCGSDDECYDERALVMVATKITLSGICRFPPYRFYWELISMTVGLISFFFVISITLVSLMIGLVNINQHQMAFVDKYNATMLTLEVLNVPDYLKKSAMTVYNTFWVNCGGYNEDNKFLKILPKATQNAVMVDIYWPALKHSKLFRSMDLPFLRYVSMFIKRNFLMPGDYIYRKNDTKTKMIYLVSGTIQLLSEEDGESPILSFTSGTCLGESCLVVNYKSINSVRCKTFCELHVLNKNEFMRIYNRFPNHLRNINEIISDRYRFAKETNNLANIAKKRLNVPERQIDIYTIFWLKNTLHKLMSRDAESIYKHEFQNIYLLNEVNENDFSKLLFTANYLDSYAISERIETDTDTVFAKSNFPCILQPNSVLIILWESVVVCFTVFISFVIPYMAFVAEISSEWYIPIIYMTTLLYWGDIYVQLSTGIKTKQGIIQKFRSITSAKMQTLGFWADMFSCVPCEMFSPVILSEITNQNSAKMHMNRILKLWRIERLFRLWEKKFNANMVMIRFIKFSWINLYTIFVLYCYFFKTQDEDHSTLIFSAVQVMTGMGILDKNFAMDNAISIIADTTTSLINLMMYAYIGSAYILNGLKLLEIQQLCRDIHEKIKFRKASEEFLTRIINFIETQQMENDSEHIKQTKSILSSMSEMTYSETMESLVGHILQTTPFLKDVAGEIILDLCAKLHIITIPPNEVLTHAGDLVSDIYIYYEGVSEVISRTGKVRREITSAETLNVLESIFALPSLDTVVTKTHCRFFVLHYDSFIQILTKFPSELKRLREVAAESVDIKQAYLELCKEQITMSKSRTATIEKKVHLFSFNMKVDSFEEYDYFVPFDRLYPFAFIRYFLMRVTFTPHGKLLYVWETVRCIFAIVASILNFTLPLVDSPYRFVLLLLDFTALVDIYFRMHVCYYNEKGILVKHPLKTAIHYISHSFVIDLLGCAPFGILSSAKDSETFILFHLNVLLQLHRYIQFIHYLRVRSLTPSSKWFTLYYVPLLLILCNLFGSLLIGVECNFDREIKANGNFTAGIRCEDDALLTISHFMKPIDPLRAHFYGIYVVSSMVTMNGMQGWNHGNDFTRTIIMILAIIGLYLSVIINANIFQIHNFRRGALLHYQEAMKSLKDFLRKHKVSHKLSTSIIENYELKWNRLKGSNMFQLIKPFTHSMRVDIMNELVGTLLYKNSPFKSANTIFYRNLSTHFSFELVIKGGYVVTINDICENVFILMSGGVDVLAADGTKLDTLHVGSMFGNLDNVKRFRLQVSVIALCHVEILVMPSVQFHKFMDRNVKLQNEFRLIKATYLSYIPSQASESESTVQTTEESNIKSTYLFHVLNPNTKSMQVWNAINLIFSCYLGILLDFYQLGAGEYSIIIITLQYASDLIYVAHVLTKRFTAYVDELGYMVEDLALISKKNKENSFKFWITVISLIPADVLALTLPLEERVSNLLYGTLRLNRVLRLTYIFDYFKITSMKLNVNLYTLRFGYILLWSSLALNGMCAVIGILSCSLEVNMEPTIMSCHKLHELSGLEKFKLYVRYMYIIGNCITLTSQHVYFPQGLWHIILCIIFMYTGQYVRICIISQIFSLLNERSLRKFRYKNLLDRVMYFLQNEDVSASLLAKVGTYIQLLWIQQKGVIYPKLLHEAPLYLLDAISNNAFSHMLKFHPIFVKCHPDCFRQIVQKLYYRTYFVGDYIQFKGSIDETMYFIYEGDVVVMIDEFVNKDGFFLKLGPGDSFGVRQGLYRRLPHKYSYRCRKRTVVLSLQLDSWEYLLDFFPASKEQIYKTARIYDGI